MWYHKRTNVLQLKESKFEFDKQMTFSTLYVIDCQIISIPVLGTLIFKYL